MCRYIFFALLIVCCATIEIRAQPCVPESVETVDLAPNGTLSWSVSDNCGKAQYQILIKGGGVVEYEYTIEALSFNVNFLKLCRVYEFSVAPEVDHIIGAETTLHAAIPLSDNINITVLNFTGAQIEDDILLQWQINENYTYCVRYYYLKTWDEESTDPETFYVGQAGHLLEHVAQCMEYHFELTIYYGDDRVSTVQKFNYTVPQRTNTPELVELEQDVTVINSTWKLEPYTLNRCNVTTLYVNSTHFNVAYPIKDTPERPEVQVSIKELKANTMYYFNVTTNNTAGISPAFQLAVQTLPLPVNSTLS